MRLADVVPYALIGILLGGGAFYAKGEADKTNALISTIDETAYEACLELNRLKAAAGKEDERLDCAKEYPR